MSAELTKATNHRLFLLLVTVLSLTLGMAVVLQPMVPWPLLAGLVAVSVLSLPPYLVACSAIILPIFSRLLVAWGIAPGFINFLHFPLAVASAALATLASYRGSRSLLARLAMGIGAFGVLSVISWLASGGSVLKLLLSWLLFAEPFLIIYALVKTTPRGKARTLSALALALAFVQVPPAFYQVATLGLGDVVQGTLVGHGAGAHVIGAITLMGVLALSSELISKRNGKMGLSRILTRGLAIAVLFMVAVLADAKQTIIAFIPAFAVLLWSYRRFSMRWLVTAASVIALILLAGYAYQPLRMATNMELILAGLGGKTISYQIVTGKMIEFPATFLLGLGPGNSVSRVALAAQEGYIRSLPQGWVSLSLSPVTADILSTTSGFYLFASSSVWSGVSSWLGLFGDLGLLGIAIYSWMLLSVWKDLRGGSSSWARSGRAVLVMGIVLGLVFSWLEMPEFTLVWALYLARGLVEIRDVNSAYPYPLLATRR